MNNKIITYHNSGYPITYHKIENGSKFTFGGKLKTVEMTIDQHFNWFQKLMWKWCFGIKVEDYREK